LFRSGAPRKEVGLFRLRHDLAWRVFSIWILFRVRCAVVNGTSTGALELLAPRFFGAVLLRSELVRGGRVKIVFLVERRRQVARGQGASDPLRKFRAWRSGEFGRETSLLTEPEEMKRVHGPQTLNPRPLATATQWANPDGPTRLSAEVEVVEKRLIFEHFGAEDTFDGKAGH
ncbi:hypothetical protein BKA80DRAFT_337750, partial [Phyllosticta citrichinensis]